MIIYGTDVDGLYSLDPKTSKDAKLLETISCSEIRKIEGSALGSRMPDVTAGMQALRSRARGQERCGGRDNEPQKT